MILIDWNPVAHVGPADQLVRPTFRRHQRRRQSWRSQPGLRSASAPRQKWLGRHVPGFLIVAAR